MIEVYINGQPCVVGDLKIELNKTNPLISEKKDHTLDITLNLTNAVNARVFKFLNRFDVSIKNSTQYHGEVRNNGQTVISGNVYVLDIDDEEVKIQIVKDDSFFRWTDAEDTRMGGGMRIDRLQLGELDAPADARPSEDYDIYKANALCIPTLTEYSDHAFQDPTIEKEFFLLNNFTSDEKNISPHPYLVRTVEAILKVLQYTVTYNALMDSVLARRLVIVSNVTGTTWEQHLPAWTVAKFMTEVEKLFNVEIRLDTNSKTAEIISRRRYTTRKISIDAYDDYEVEIEDAGKGLNIYDNARYNFPAEEMYYKEADLSEEQLAVFEFRDVPYGQIPNNSLFKPTMFRQTLGDVKLEQYFCRYDGYTYEAYLIPVRNYQHLGNYEADNVMKFDIIPCMHTCFYPTIDMQMNALFTTLPVGRNYDKPEDVNQSTSLEIIKDGIKEPATNNDDKMYIAMYGGWTDNPSNSWPYIRIPFAINNVMGLPYYLYGVDQTHYAEYDLSLDKMKKEFYYEEEIDTTNKYKVKAKVPFYEKIDNIIFNIKNKLFVVDTIKYTLASKDNEPTAELELYPLKGQS